MKPHEPGRDRSQRIGLFGGTFNPVHQGHLYAAKDVLHQMQLDLIYLIPSAVPPHKSGGRLVPAEQRLEMVRLALDDQEQFKACDVEVKRAGPSYTIDTVRYFNRNLSEESELYFVLGVDAFLDIHTWKSFDALFNEVAFVVMSRPGAGQWSDDTVHYVETYIKERISSKYKFIQGEKRFIHPDKKQIHLVSVTPVDIASSRIRAMIRAGQSLSPWVCPEVVAYITKQGLYI